MMLPTHALGGMALGLAVGAAVPEFGAVAVAAGLLGGVFPDLDLYAGHRKRLHFPVYYSALAPAALAAAALAPGVATVAGASFVLGAAVHSVADAFGGGLELRPWEASSDRAVYDHYRGRWVAPRRWVRYDGSPGDLLLSVVIAVPLSVALDGVLLGVVAACLAVGAVYAAVRRLLPAVVDALVAGVLAPRLPDRLLERVPERYRRTTR
jgi:hypothetical protein